MEASHEKVVQEKQSVKSIGKGYVFTILMQSQIL